jgi:hypothetical protein
VGIVHDEEDRAVNIVVAYPPNIEQIAGAFPACRRQPTLFCWGSTIFNPGNIRVDDSLIAHERIHCDQTRDAGGPENWWEQYIASAEFRFAQELPAHRAEYRSICEKLGMTRNLRRIHLRQIARRLAGPLYGGLVKVHEAKKLIGGRDADD